jgi:hypothetical protein
MRDRFARVGCAAFDPSGHRPPFFVAMHATDPPSASERPLIAACKSKSMAAKSKATFFPQ